MPFITPDLLFHETSSFRHLLITSADDCDVIKTSFELAKLLYKGGESVLWIDGNLGENQPFQMAEDPNLEAVLSEQLPVTQIIQQIEGVSVISGIAKHFLGEQTNIKQQQFLQDLRLLYPNYDKVVLAVNGKNPELQKKWMAETENIYLMFNAKNILLNRTLAWLKENTAKGLIGIGRNDQDVLLSYMRLKEVLGEVPELILDIKKIAP